jgi:hypothetical protein
MKIAYFDCFSGASGDMILSALIDAGFDIERLREDLEALAVSGFQVKTEQVRKQGFAATRFDVQMAEDREQPHRHLKHIREIIQNSALPAKVQEQALAIFTRLAEAEGAVHGTTAEKVHFHEVGAVDAIVDIVGACIALDRMGIEQVYCSPIPTGNGTVQCEHGLMPVPAPATAKLLTGYPLATCEEQGELTTPTGAAILTTLADSFGVIPAMRLQQTGVGAGRREGQRRPNVLRVMIGEAEAGDTGETDEIVVLEANLDDISPEVIGYTSERLLACGALDVFTLPIYMKKNRPGTLLTVLAPVEQADELEAIIFRETSTFGVRRHVTRRRKLIRETETAETEHGAVRIKIGRQGGQIVTAAPEYEDCRQVAEKSGLSLREIMDQALRNWRQSSG